MARGRHARRSGLLARILLVGASWRRPGGSRRVRWNQQEVAVLALRTDLGRLEAEVARLRVLGAEHAGTAAAADLRARRAEEALSATTLELAGLRSDLAALREELVWAFAERKLAVEAPGSAPAATAAPAADGTTPGRVIDLTAARTGSTG